MLESVDLTDEIRAKQPGSSAQLTDGTVYYQLEGSERGELVVLIHGMSIPSFVWEPTSQALVNTGFRVLRYDLFGRGYSDRPKGKHNLALYTRQLGELLDVLQLNAQPLNLIGMSLGGAICVAFALQQTSLVKRIGLISPVHPNDMPSTPAKYYKLLVRINSLAMATSRQVVNSFGK